MFGVSVTFKGPLKKKVDGLPAEIKAALYDAIKLWHSEFMPHHFGEWSEVNSRYPGVYRARTPKYERDKNKEYGHNRMLEWSGFTKAMALSKITITGTSKQVKGRISGTNRGFNFGDGLRRPDMRSELTATNTAEQQELADFIGKRVEEFLGKNTPVETVTL